MVLNSGDWMMYPREEKKKKRCSAAVLDLPDGMRKKIQCIHNSGMEPATQRHLPADLVPEILSRLPVKSLLRFRPVAKPWLALVDHDATFARTHLNTFKDNRHGSRLLVEKIGYLDLVDYDVRCGETFEPIPETLQPWNEAPICSCHWTINSVDGLILLNYYREPTGIFNTLKLWNPSIRKLLEIPPILEPGLSSCSFQFFSVDIGLGYDPVANDYKIVKLIFLNGTRTLHSVAIYNLGAGSWKFIKLQGDWQWTVWVSEAVYFQSSLYFIAHNKCWDKGKDLVRFDLSKVTFSSVKMPGGIERVNCSWKLVPINGGSALEVFNWNRSSIYVWSLDSKSVCWTKTHVYCLEDVNLLHVKKNGDMMMQKLDKCAQRFSGNMYKEWRNEATSFSRKIKEYKC